MRQAVSTMSARTKNWIFGVAYVAIALCVLCPPVYRWASGESPRVLGLPFSVFWMLLNGILVLLLVWALWVVEDLRGEHEMFEPDEEVGG